MENGAPEAKKSVPRESCTTECTDEHGSLDCGIDWAASSNFRRRTQLLVSISRDFPAPGDLLPSIENYEAS